MFSDRVRYYRVGGMIYIFNLSKRRLTRYGFKPFHKRKRFKDPRLLHSSHRFYILSDTDFYMSDPTAFLKMYDAEWREFKIGDYL